MTTSRIRAFMLKPGDDFIMNGRKYRLVYVKSGLMYFYIVDQYGRYTGTKNTMSAKSKQWVEIVINKTK